MIRNGYMYGRRIGEFYRILENGHLPLLRSLWFYLTFHILVGFLENAAFVCFASKYFSVALRME
ncbi:hypothetical protein T4D_10576 [Trichinella pseudospiralis]|uniref:Uncharacterized protein n=1 Tax=Trichinella pseudospiralis TaxID=6337 RepID=A0A0V1DTE4_TRIPS|nr:hypothetical protein T4D_10576 [Trichinella pseudospiralis]